MYRVAGSGGIEKRRRSGSGMARLCLLLCLLLPVVVRVVRGEGVISKVSMLPLLSMVPMASMVRGEGVLSMLNKREQHSQVSRKYHPHFITLTPFITITPHNTFTTGTTLTMLSTITTHYPHYSTVVLVWVSIP